MSAHHPEFQRAYAEQNRQDQIYYSTLATVLSIVLNLSCSVMDHFMYPNLAELFFKVRLLSVVLLALVWVWFRSPLGNQHHRIFGATWYAIPLAMILWMIYAAHDPYCPYYAGLNIILLAVGLLSPWTYRQNLISAAFVVVFYVVVDLSMRDYELSPFMVNNTTFLLLTAVIVVSGSLANARQRQRAFELRWELDQSRKMTESSLLQLKENEIHVVQSEKMASLGRMSAGIIHEINNPLNFATTGLYTLRNKGKYLAPEQQAEYAEVLRDVEEGISRVRTIVADLRTFSHPDGGHRDDIKIAPVVALSLRFLSNEWRDRVEIRTEIAEGLTAYVNQNRLVHVLVNLLQNSIDALKTKSFSEGRPTIVITGRTEDDRSLLSIRDNGPGINPEHMDKIFEPFYTTKEVGEGMGMGLSICHRIVSENGGKISVKTRPGEFCEFTLEFLSKG
ncbi:MAG: ATP-binding protein [Verrucomicrobiota bacterium]